MIAGVKTLMASLLRALRASSFSMPCRCKQVHNSRGVSG
jgi:hypothetical protein